MTPGESSPWDVRLRAVLLLLAVFTAGAFVGAGIYRFADLDRAEERMPPPPPWRMFHELDLTPDQQTKIKAVFEQHRPKIDAILHEAFPKVHVIQEQIDADVSKLLTPQQNEKLKEIRKRRGPPRGDRMHHPGPPPGDMPFGMPDPNLPPPGLPPREVPNGAVPSAFPAP
jgi:Spy/CpxP family protein refolding chaperone